MKVACPALPLEIVLQFVLLVRTFADAGHVAVLVDVASHGDPGFSGGGTIRGRLQPSVLYPGDEREGEHA